MANKNITMQQKNTAGSYDKLYPKTTATQSKLSAETAALYGDGVTDADAAMRIVANTIKDLGFATVIVKDPSGNPIQGAIITGIQGSPTTDANGKASGTLQSATITVNSPYVDLQSQTISVSGSFQSVNVTLPTVGENAIKRFTSSQSVKFSKLIRMIDVCCVGGGGGGCSALYASSDQTKLASGGGGGGIVNGLNITPDIETIYNLIIGSGGNAYTTPNTSGGDGGATSAFNIIASGGFGGSPSDGGNAGSDGAGKGGRPSQSGESNTTLSEFNDGATFYSGGGGGGASVLGTLNNKGLPNGANGANVRSSSVHASTASVGGGGGGGGDYSYSNYRGNPSEGGSGLVAIRFHF